MDAPDPPPPNWTICTWMRERSLTVVVGWRAQNRKYGLLVNGRYRVVSRNRRTRRAHHRVPGPVPCRYEWMTSTSRLIAVAPVLSVTFMSTLKVPAVPGFPEMVPDRESARPFGR